MTASAPPATVLHDDRSIVLTDVRGHRDDDAALWIRAADLARVSGFEVKPQGACFGDICVPIAAAARDGDYVSLTAFARTVGAAVVADVEARVWSVGGIPALGVSRLESRHAPDVAVPDRQGRPRRLSEFRGRKVLVLTWASW